MWSKYPDSEASAIPYLTRGMLNFLPDLTHSGYKKRASSGEFVAGRDTERKPVSVSSNTTRDQCHDNVQVQVKHTRCPSFPFSFSLLLSVSQLVPPSVVPNS